VRLDAHDAALWAIIAICLVLLGALLTPGSLAIEQRGAVLAAIVTVLLTIGWRVRRRRDDDNGGS
jgi:membrane protein implicated in regulation of membrane protease activity